MSPPGAYPAFWKGGGSNSPKNCNGGVLSETCEREGVEGAELVLRVRILSSQNSKLRHEYVKKYCHIITVL